MRTFALMLALTLAISSLVHVEAQGKPKGEWKAICGADGRPLQLFAVLAQKDNYYVTGRFEGEPRRAFQIVKGIAVPLKDASGAAFYPHPGCRFFVGDKLVAANWPNPLDVPGPDEAEALEPGPNTLHVLDGATARPINFQGKPVKISDKAGGGTPMAYSPVKPDSPYFRLVETEAGTDGRPQVTKDQLVLLKGIEATLVETPEAYAESMVYWDGKLLFASKDKLLLFDGKSTQPLQDAKGNAYAPGDVSGSSFCCDYIMFRRSGKPDEILHLKDRKLLPVALEKDSAVIDLYAIGRTVIARTYAPKAGGKFKDGKFSVIKDETLQPFAPTKDIKEAGVKWVYPVDGMLVISAQEGQEWSHFVVDEKSSTKFSLPQGASKDPVGAAMGWNGSVAVFYRATKTGIAVVDKKGNPTVALDEMGKPIVIEGRPTCLAGPDGFFVFGTSELDSITGAWFRPTK